MFGMGKKKHVAVVAFKKGAVAFYCIWFLVCVVVGVFIGVAGNLLARSTDADDNNVKPVNEFVGFLDPNSPYCAIPKNTKIVAARSGAFIVKSTTNEQHYVVYLYTKKVESIPFVDVVTKPKAKGGAK